MSNSFPVDRPDALLNRSGRTAPRPNGSSPSGPRLGGRQGWNGPPQAVAGTPSFTTVPVLTAGSSASGFAHAQADPDLILAVLEDDVVTVLSMLDQGTSIFATLPSQSSVIRLWQEGLQRNAPGARLPPGRLCALQLAILCGKMRTAALMMHFCPDCEKQRISPLLREMLEDSLVDGKWKIAANVLEVGQLYPLRVRASVLASCMGRMLDEGRHDLAADLLAGLPYGEHQEHLHSMVLLFIAAPEPVLMQVALAKYQPGAGERKQLLDYAMRYPCVSVLMALKSLNMPIAKAGWKNWRIALTKAIEEDEAHALQWLLANYLPKLTLVSHCMVHAAAGGRLPALDCLLRHCRLRRASIVWPASGALLAAIENGHGECAQRLIGMGATLSRTAAVSAKDLMARLMREGKVKGLAALVQCRQARAPEVFTLLQQKGCAALIPTLQAKLDLRLDLQAGAGSTITRLRRALAEVPFSGAVIRSPDTLAVHLLAIGAAPELARQIAFLQCSLDQALHGAGRAGWRLADAQRKLAFAAMLDHGLPSRFARPAREAITTILTGITRMLYQVALAFVTSESDADQAQAAVIHRLETRFGLPNVHARLVAKAWRASRSTPARRYGMAPPSSTRAAQAKGVTASRGAASLALRLRPLLERPLPALPPELAAFASWYAQSTQLLQDACAAILKSAGQGQG